MTAVWLYVTVDRDRDVALLRGPGMVDVRRVFDGLGGAYAEMTFTYSRAARGWVIPARYAPDIEAYAQSRYALCVVHERRETAA